MNKLILEITRMLDDCINKRMAYTVFCECIKEHKAEIQKTKKSVIIDLSKQNKTFLLDLHNRLSNVR